MGCTYSLSILSPILSSSIFYFSLESKEYFVKTKSFELSGLEEKQALLAIFLFYSWCISRGSMLKLNLRAKA